MTLPCILFLDSVDVCRKKCIMHLIPNARMQYQEGEKVFGTRKFSAVTDDVKLLPKIRLGKAGKRIRRQEELGGDGDEVLDGAAVVGTGGRGEQHRRAGWGGRSRRDMVAILRARRGSGGSCGGHWGTR